MCGKLADSSSLGAIMQCGIPVITATNAVGLMLATAALRFPFRLGLAELICFEVHAARVFVCGGG